MSQNRRCSISRIAVAIAVSVASTNLFAPRICNAQEVTQKNGSEVRAFMDDQSPGWRSLTKDDFAQVNSAGDTWSWKGGVLHCTGQPISVLRTKQEFHNVEILVEWMHEKPAGNSGLFVWVTPASIQRLTAAGAPGLPDGIEIQMLDHAFTELRKSQGRSTDFFGTNGDVFGVNRKFEPFEPLSPDGSRSFPRKHLCKGHGQWNQYYVRAIDGEVRLWVNGEEVSGGNGVDPASGYLCLESEGSPIQFRKLRVRELPTPSASNLGASESSSDQMLAKSLIGSWRIADAHRDGAPSKVHYGVVTIKHITPSGFVWLSYDPKDRKTFRSMGGSWKVENGKYIETALYGMHENFIEKKFGNVTSIDAEVEQDVFTQTIHLEQGSKFIEIWKRIAPGEDPVKATHSE